MEPTMNLQGIHKLRTEYLTGRRLQRYAIRVCYHWSQCYEGRYRKRSPHYAQAQVHRTKLWARSRSYNQPPRRK